MTATLVMPNLGAASDEARLAGWLVREGERVSAGQPIYEIETDKSLVTVEATEDGEIGQFLVAAGETVPIGTPIAEFRPALGTHQATAEIAPVPGFRSVEASEGVPQERTEDTAIRSVAAGQTAAGRVSVSPRARRVAARLGIDASKLAGSGPDGQVVEADVLAASKGGASATTPAPTGLETEASAETARRERATAFQQPDVAEDELAGLSGARAVIARRMSASARSTAAVTLMIEVGGDALVAAVEHLRLRYPDVAQGITFDLLIARCVARALLEHPQLNGTLTARGIVLRDHINVGIALDATSGLVVPVLRDTAEQPLLELARTWQELRARALASRSSPEELAGGTFTITNLGHLGIDFFSPIINPGETAILGVGRIAHRPVVRGGHMGVARTIPLSLTFDHRVVDGAQAARFLKRVGELIEQPEDARLGDSNQAERA
jgi:pyruvate dehydrogenase E2 component (dihydrolipoamide acetyltransferase)